ncbi:hypothetical protein ACOSQ2_003207 [Xanthoceras sorbifolium]
MELLDFVTRPRLPHLRRPFARPPPVGSKLAPYVGCPFPPNNKIRLGLESKKLRIKLRESRSALALFLLPAEKRMRATSAARFAFVAELVSFWSKTPPWYAPIRPPKAFVALVVHRSHG